MSSTKQKHATNILPFQPVRIETELSQYPFHNLGSVQRSAVEINQITKSGQKILWQITPNQKYGMPGQLAYKLDTLVINRKIDEAGPVKPKCIALGSLRQIARQLRCGGDTKAVEPHRGRFLTIRFW